MVTADCRMYGARRRELTSWITWVDWKPASVAGEGTLGKKSGLGTYRSEEDGRARPAWWGGPPGPGVPSGGDALVRLLAGRPGGRPRGRAPPPQPSPQR